MKFVLIPNDGGGYESIIGDISNVNLPDHAEVYDSEQEWNDRVNEFL